MSRYLKCVCLGCFAFKIPLCGTNFTPVSIAQHYTQTRRTHDKKKRIKFNDKTAIFYGIGRLEDAKIEIQRNMSVHRIVHWTSCIRADVCAMNACVCCTQWHHRRCCSQNWCRAFFVSCLCLLLLFSLFVFSLCRSIIITSFSHICFWPISCSVRNMKS